MTDKEVREMFNLSLREVQGWIRDIGRERLEHYFPHPSDLAYADILDATIAMGEPDPPRIWYDFPMRRREWKLSSLFLANFKWLISNRNIDKERRATMIHLFVLHEIYHSHQGLTSERYRDIDNATVSLQRIDYLADAYSILACYQFYTYFDKWDVRIGDQEESDSKPGQERWRDKLEYLIHSALRSMEVFEPKQESPFQLDVARFTRYLTWHFQAARAHHFTQNDTNIDDFLLTEWPVLELRGLQVAQNHISQLAEYDNLRLIISWADHIYRLDASPSDIAKDIVDGVTSADYQRSKNAMRSLLDQAKRLVSPNRDWINVPQIKPIELSREEEKQHDLRIREEGFFDFFGGSSKDMDFHLVCSKRTLTNHTSRFFQYPYAERLLIDPRRVKQRDEVLSIPWSPLPKEVKGWLAYEDMIVASRMGRLFGEMCGRQVQIDLDKDDDHWADNPTIAIGLGFTWHTRKLLEASGLINVIGIDWSEQEPITDSFLFDGKPYCDRQDSYDYALVARVLTGGSNVHFICAGRTAPGTAAAGRYLQERWSYIYKLYAIPREMNKKSVAVLIKHPHLIEIVCSGRIDLIEYVSHVFV
jgi:hypothetical protein